MQSRSQTAPLFFLLAVLAIFICYTTQTLPPIVASHFSASGEPNGFMSRTAYLILMLAVIVGAPLLTTLLPAKLIDKNSNNINVPNRDYWLAPERQEQTRAALLSHMQIFSAMLALFLAYVHWLVVQANRMQHPLLSTTTIVYGLIGFFIAIAIWLVMLYRRFRSPA